ncbi:HEAT repeat domain-containing protein [Nakamurella sp. GG22]
MLRHYDAIGLVSPTRTLSNGYREYTHADIARLFRVESLRTLGLSLNAIQQTMTGEDFPPSELFGELIASTQARIEREQALLRRLISVRDSQATSWDEVLELVALMQYLVSPDPSRRQSAALSAPQNLPADALVDTLLNEDDPNVAGALQWNLARSIHAALPQLVAALESPDPQTRRRAIVTIIKVQPDDLKDVLRQALLNPDHVVRERAASALGGRGDKDAVPELIDMIVRGADDVEAADLLGRVAGQHDLGDHITEHIVGRLARAEEVPGSRSRLTQALAEIPGTKADLALAELARDADVTVSITARYIVTRRP